MEGARVVIVRTGTANLASVEAAFGRCGARSVFSEDPAQVAAADHVVLPGVGTFKAAMDRLTGAGLVEILADRVRAARPTLAICLGLQLLFETSEENPGTPGLSVLGGRVTRLPAHARIPHIGWNRIEPEAGASTLEPGYGYFANSYRVDAVPAGWTAAWAEHGDRWVAALERGSVLACQFHPELSGAWGHALLRRWLAQAAVPC